MADDDPDDVQRGSNSAPTPAPEVDSGCNSGEGSSPVGKTGSERQQMSSSSNHSSILESMTGPLSKRLRTLHTLQQQQKAPTTSGLATNTIFFCFLFVKTHLFAWRANQ